MRTVAGLGMRARRTGWKVRHFLLDTAELLKELPEYDDLVITHSNREMDRFMAEYSKRNPTEGVYPIRETFPNLFDP